MSSEGRNHEQTINQALGNVLATLRQAWQVDAEKVGILEGNKRADVLLREESGWPVVIEAEMENHDSAEGDAIGRLGLKPAGSTNAIETAIALIYPKELHTLDGEALRDAIRATQDLEYALYTRVADDEAGLERLLEKGWLKGSVIELAMLAHRASTPPQRVEALAASLEAGVEDAMNLLDFAFGGERGKALADVLGQSDDDRGQTRRMAMAVLVNALVFQEALAQAEFRVSTPTGEGRACAASTPSSTGRRFSATSCWRSGRHPRAKLMAHLRLGEGDALAGDSAHGDGGEGRLSAEGHGQQARAGRHDALARPHRDGLPAADRGPQVPGDLLHASRIGGVAGGSGAAAVGSTGRGGVGRRGDAGGRCRSATSPAARGRCSRRPTRASRCCTSCTGATRRRCTAR